MNDLDTFISGLYATGSRAKTSGLDGFSVGDLGRIYGTPASHLEAAEKLAHDAACFLEQFEGTPLHAQAIALVGEELGIEAERIQRDEARRAQQEPVDDSWSKQRMIDLKKRQLELELHKMKAEHEGAEGREQEVQERAEGVPAPQTTGAVPAKTAALAVAGRLSRTKKASPQDVARGLLTGGKKEAWRNAAQYMSPADLLAKAQQSGKAQSGGISRSVSDYLTKKASLGARVVAAAQRGAQQAATGMASRAAFPAVAKAPPTAPNGAALAASFLAKQSPYMLKVPGSR